jgi:hypothetical protein
LEIPLSNLILCIYYCHGLSFDFSLRLITLLDLLIGLANNALQIGTERLDIATEFEMRSEL